MFYPIAIESGDAAHAYGIIVPDLPGCFSAGETFDEAIALAREAIEMHLQALLDAGEQLPSPGDVVRYTRNREYAHSIWMMIEIPAEALDTRIERVNVTLPRRVLRAIDRAAGRAGKSRSGFLAEAALRLAQETATPH